MKFNTKSHQELLRKAQVLTKKEEETLYLAKSKHKAMKRAFKGIMTYQQRKILFNVGQHNMRNKNGE